MDPSTKRQLVGAGVLVALAVIFLPMIFSGSEDPDDVDVPVEVPPREEEEPEPEELTEQPPEDEGEPEELLGDPLELDQRVEDPDEAPGVEEAEEPAREEASEADEPEERDETDRPEEDEEEPAKEEDDTPVEGVDLEEGAYGVQVGSFREAGNARAERDRIRELGLPASVQVGSDDDGELHRVLLGPVMERDDAESLLERAREDADLDGFVRSL